MTERQYRKADRMVCITLMVVVVGIFLNMLGMLTAGKNYAVLNIVVLSIMGAIVMMIMYHKKKGTRSCGIMMTAVAAWVTFFGCLKRA